MLFRNFSFEFHVFAFAKKFFSHYHFGASLVLCHENTFLEVGKRR